MSALGRLPFRPDDRDWPVSSVKALIATGDAVPLKWSVPRILDQGANGTCVAAGTLGACDCDDENHVLSAFASADIIPFFQTIAGAGPLPDGGAEVREGLKAAQKAGYIKAYSLLKDEAEIKDWQENHGPVVVGADWMSSMDAPNALGFVTFDGTVRGGHCFYGNGDVGGQDFVNSWGDQWADSGHFYMTDAEFTKMQNGDFEVWAVVQAAPSPTPTPTPPPTPAPSHVKQILTDALALAKKEEATISKEIADIEKALASL